MRFALKSKTGNRWLTTMRHHSFWVSGFVDPPKGISIKMATGRCIPTPFLHRNLPTESMQTWPEGAPLRPKYYFPPGPPPLSAATANPNPPPWSYRPRNATGTGPSGSQSSRSNGPVAEMHVRTGPAFSDARSNSSHLRTSPALRVAQAAGPTHRRAMDRCTPAIPWLMQAPPTSTSLRAWTISRFVSCFHFSTQP